MTGREQSALGLRCDEARKHAFRRSGSVAFHAEREPCGDRTRTVSGRCRSISLELGGQPNATQEPVTLGTGGAWADYILKIGHHMEMLANVDVVARFDERFVRLDAMGLVEQGLTEALLNFLGARRAVADLRIGDEKSERVLWPSRKDALVGNRREREAGDLRVMGLE